MKPSTYIGRIGGLAAALGVGAALFTGCGVAWATPPAADSSASGTETGGAPDPAKTPTNSSTDTESTTPGSSAGGVPKRSPIFGNKRNQGPLAGIFGHRPTSTPTSQAPSDDTEDPTQGTDDTTGANATTQPKKNRSSSKPAKVDTSSTATSTAATGGGTVATTNVAVKTTPIATPPKTSGVVAQLTAKTASTLSTVSSTQSSPATATAAVTTQPATETAAKPATIATVIAAAINQFLHPFAGNNPAAPAVDSPTNWIMLAAARRQLSGAATPAALSAAAVSPTLVLNGYNVVATSQEHVTSLYGMFTNFPGFQGVVQGDQSFALVDPTTGETVGTFDALVSNNNSISAGQKYVQLVVTNSTGNVGTGAGQTPPVGSVIASYGTGTYGSVYTAMPSAAGDVVSYKYLTPFGNIPLFTGYNAANTLTDYVSVNKPVVLGDGYYIAPTTPSTEKFTAITGFPPLFTALQGTQNYTVYKVGTNEAVGTFDGLVTTTSDTLGTYTKAIYVTDSTGNVGTGVGQVPPVGTVYNAIYFGSDDTYTIYSSKPSALGDVVSTSLVSKGKVTPLSIDFDASTAPPITLKVPGKYTLVPVGAKQVVGINGLPPREVEIQAYQQYEVHDASGNTIGTFDGDVTSQWDVSGGRSESVLVTNVTSGTIGAGAGKVPPVGSVFNFNDYGNGYAQVYSAIPSPFGDVVSYNFVTPFGAIPLYTSYDAAAGLTDYSYFDPFLQSMLAFEALGIPQAASSGSAPCTSSLEECQVL